MIKVDWQIAQVSLAAYAGTDVTIQFVGTTGTSFTSDMAIDAISIDKCVAYGCTDPLAPNYDPAATMMMVHVHSTVTTQLLQ